MKTTKQTPPQGIDDMAATTVRLGRELAQMSHAACLGGNSHENGFAMRTLRRLAERAPFDPRDDASLGALHGIIAADVKSEARGSNWQLFETGGNADGPDVELRECPVNSERGQELLRIQNTFLRFVAARNATLDRIAAERALLQLMTI